VRLTVSPSSTGVWACMRGYADARLRPLGWVSRGVQAAPDVQSTRQVLDEYNQIYSAELLSFIVTMGKVVYENPPQFR
jgi:hypothetical protein